MLVVLVIYKRDQEPAATRVFFVLFAIYGQRVPYNTESRIPLSRQEFLYKNRYLYRSS